LFPLSVRASPASEFASGTYELSESLHVPDGVTLIGEGTMEFDAAGLPEGIGSVGRTVLKSTASLTGDVVRLGNGAGLQALVVEDVSGRIGNVVVVSSRAPGDSVAGTIFQCEIMSPNPAAGSPAGPSGRGVLLITRNELGPVDPPPHPDSSLSLSMYASIVHSPGGGSGLMAINFSSNSRISVILVGNVFGGGLDVAGGVSRPNAVRESSISIDSSGNLYRSEFSLPVNGWQLYAGVDAPLLPQGVVAETAILNRLEFISSDDQLRGFSTGIFAAAGFRYNQPADVISMNELEIRATDLVMQSTNRDLVLYGDASSVASRSAGDGNILRAVLRDSSGSGLRDNRYGHSSTSLGTDNALILPGNANAFVKSNRNIRPAPAAELFTGWH